MTLEAMHIAAMNEEYARSISRWRYGGAYFLYDQGKVTHARSGSRFVVMVCRR